MPPTGPFTEPFWSALSRGRFAVLQCGDCQGRHFCWNADCPYCRSTSSAWVEVSGEGVLYSFVIAHRAAGQAANVGSPPVIAVVRLEDGTQIMCNPDHREVTPAERLKVGTPVRLVYSEIKRAYPSFGFVTVA